MAARLQTLFPFGLRESSFLSARFRPRTDAHVRNERGKRPWLPAHYEDQAQEEHPPAVRGFGTKQPPVPAQSAEHQLSASHRPWPLAPTGGTVLPTGEPL